MNVVTIQNSHVRNCPANSARPPPNTMPLICRLAPASPNMNIRPPITIATSDRDRASGPVNVASRLSAARSQGLCCAYALTGTNRSAVPRITMRVLAEKRGADTREMNRKDMMTSDDAIARLGVNDWWPACAGLVTAVAVRANEVTGVMLRVDEGSYELLTGGATGGR